MRALIFFATLFLASIVIVRAQEESASPTAEEKSYPEVPKEYEVGKETLSPDGRFALLYPVRNEESDEASVPNVLVRLKPYAVLQEIDIGNGVGWIGSRGAPAAKWNGNNFVAVWRKMKWGDEYLVIYEIENDKVKRVEKPWPEIVKYFDHDFHGRFLKKYPKESDTYTFVSDDPHEKNFEFKDHKLLLKIFADNKPNLAAGPHWTAELHAVWDLDTAKFDKVDFQPGKIEVRKQLE